jgi:ABC-type dipeptide/oligopeptide/nickel transport system permease subunit
LWPGMALTMLLVALNFLSDALRDALDPRRVR